MFILVSRRLAPLCRNLSSSRHTNIKGLKLFTFSLISSEILLHSPSFSSAKHFSFIFCCRSKCFEGFSDSSDFFQLEHPMYGFLSMLIAQVRKNKQEKLFNHTYLPPLVITCTDAHLVFSLFFADNVSGFGSHTFPSDTSQPTLMGSPVKD